MPKISRFIAASGVAVLSLAMVGCAQPYRQSPPVYQGGYPSAPSYGGQPGYAQPTGTEYGRVAQIEVLPGNGGRGQTTGAGSVLGAVIGGALGNQVGKGSGRAAATVVGVLGGAVAGNAVERNNNGGQAYAQGGYRIVIQLDQGGQRLYDVSNPGDLRAGDRVRVDNGQISRY
jgi:outer membrane lipoprotein SlyB